MRSNQLSYKPTPAVVYSISIGIRRMTGEALGYKLVSVKPSGGAMQGFERVTVYGVSFDAASKQPIVLLRAEGRNLFLPIWIGHPEAAAILMKLQNADLPRPMTHDLLANVIDQLHAERYQCSRDRVA